MAYFRPQKATFHPQNGAFLTPKSHFSLGRRVTLDVGIDLLPYVTRKRSDVVRRCCRRYRFACKSPHVSKGGTLIMTAPKKRCLSAAFSRSPRDYRSD